MCTVGEEHTERDRKAVDGVCEVGEVVNVIMDVIEKTGDGVADEKDGTGSTLGGLNDTTTKVHSSIVLRERESSAAMAGCEDEPKTGKMNLRRDGVLVMPIPLTGVVSVALFVGMMPIVARPSFWHGLETFVRASSDP